MLNNFPVEIVTECLLGLGIYDLLQIVKTNRRLYAIAHAEKSPLRHRLKKHFSIGLQLHTYSSLGLVEEDEVECQEEGRVRPQMHLAFDNENPIREIESVTLRVDRKAEPIPDSDRYSHCFELKFWSKCCNKHDANKEVKYEPDDIRYPEQLVAKMNDLHWPPTPQMMMIDIKHRNKEEALQNLVLFWHYLSSYYIVRGEYCVKINNDLSPWTALEPFFRENPTNIRSGPWIDLSHVEIEPETFFANPAFNYGFYRFYYGKVQAIDDPTNRSLYHRMLRQTSYVYIYDDLTGSGLDDENLCLFKDTERFSIGCSTSVTPNGWAKLVEYYYKAWRWMENISIRVNGDFPVQSLVSLIPKENYEYRTEKGHQGEDKPTFIVTNVHGELFKISVLYFIEIGPIYDDEDDYLPEEEALLKVKERKEKMKDESICFGSLHLAYGQNVDPECACNLGNLWLDVVIVIDNSQNMGHNGLNQIAATIATVFVQSNITQALGQTTRVGIVTYGQTAVVKYNLTAFNDTNTFINALFDVCNKLTTDTASYIYTGLSAARDVLHDGRVNGKRNNVRQAIIVYAADYKSQGQDKDPVQLARDIRASGIDIITVGLKQSIDDDLAKLATPGMAFNNTDTDLVGEIQRNGLCQINCFCPGVAWTQYTSQFGLASARRFALCLHLGDIDAMWVAAKIACQSMDNSAYLVSEFSEAKHNFTYQLFKNSGMLTPYMYYFGLGWDVSSQQWMWEQPVNQPKLPLSGSSYTAWNPGEPSSKSCVINWQLTPDASPGWSTGNCYGISAPYVCQVDGCDTDHYCK